MKPPIESKTFDQFSFSIISDIVITAHIFAEIRNRKQQIDAMRRVIQLLPQVHILMKIIIHHLQSLFPGQQRHDVRPPELPSPCLSEQ